jgi:HEAT repeat protein
MDGLLIIRKMWIHCPNLREDPVFKELVEEQMLSEFEKSEADVREMMLHNMTLFGIKNGKAFQICKDSVNESNKGVRIAAISHLGYLVSFKAEAVDVLLPFLEGNDDDSKIPAVRALAKLGSIEATNGLLKLIETDNSIASKESSSALLAIGKIFPNDVLRVQTILKDDTKDKSIRTNLLWLLIKSENLNSELVPILTSMLDVSSNELKAAAIIALGKIGPRAQSALPALIKISSVENNSYLQKYLLESIRMIRGNSQE